MESSKSIPSTAIPTIRETIDAKQDKLISGETIKTVNGQSILGAGNLTTSSVIYEQAITLAEDLTLGSSSKVKFATLPNFVSKGYLHFLKFRVELPQGAHYVTKIYYRPKYSGSLQDEYVTTLQCYSQVAGGSEYICTLPFLKQFSALFDGGDLYLEARAMTGLIVKATGCSVGVLASVKGTI